MANNYISDYVGSATTVYVANYSDLKLQPLVPTLKNSVLIKALAIAGSVFYTSGNGNFLTNALRGGGSWAVGSLLEPYIANRIQRIQVTATPGVTITPSTGTATITPVATTRTM